MIYECKDIMDSIYPFSSATPTKIILKSKEFNIKCDNPEELELVLSKMFKEWEDWVGNRNGIIQKK